MDKLIKIINKDKANELISLGYNYAKETVNGHTVYSFFMSDELMKYMQAKFSNKDYIMADKLTF